MKPARVHHDQRLTNSPLVPLSTLEQAYASKPQTSSGVSPTAYSLKAAAHL